MLLLFIVRSIVLAIRDRKDETVDCAVAVK